MLRVHRQVARGVSRSNDFVRGNYPAPIARQQALRANSIRRLSANLWQDSIELNPRKSFSSASNTDDNAKVPARLIIISDLLILGTAALFGASFVGQLVLSERGLKEFTVVTIYYLITSILMMIYFFVTWMYWKLFVLPDLLQNLEETLEDIEEEEESYGDLIPNSEDALLNTLQNNDNQSELDQNYSGNREVVRKEEESSIAGTLTQSKSTNVSYREVFGSEEDEEVKDVNPWYTPRALAASISLRFTRKLEVKGNATSNTDKQTVTNIKHNKQITKENNDSQQISEENKKSLQNTESKNAYEEECINSHTKDEIIHALSTEFDVELTETAELAKDSRSLENNNSEIKLSTPKSTNKNEISSAGPNGTAGLKHKRRYSVEDAKSTREALKHFRVISDQKIIPIDFNLAVLGILLCSQFQRHSVLSWGVYLGCIHFAASVFQQFGIARTTAGQAGFISTFDLFMIPFFSYFITSDKEKTVTTWVTYVSVLICLVGIFLLSGGSGFDSFSIGDLFVLISTFFWGLHLVETDIATGYDTINEYVNHVLCIEFLTVASITGITSAFLEPDSWIIFFDDPVFFVPWFAFLAFTNLSFIFLAWGQEYSPPLHAGIILNMEGIFAALADFIYFGTQLEDVGYVGAALITISAFFAELDIKKVAIIVDENVLKPLRSSVSNLSALVTASRDSFGKDQSKRQSSEISVQIRDNHDDDNDIIEEYV